MARLVGHDPYNNAIPEAPGLTKTPTKKKTNTSGDVYYTPPKDQSSGTYSAPNATSSRDSNGPNYSGSSSGGSSGGGTSSAMAAENRAIARQTAANTKAGQNYMRRAQNLEAQAKALKYALSDKGYRRALNNNLRDVMRNWQDSFGLLKDNSRRRYQGFSDTAEDNEKALAQQVGSSFENVVRERQDILANVLTQGAGETDALRAMVIAARNWRDNTTEGMRAYYDTARTINNGITDLNLDTKSAMANAYTDLQGERERLYQDLYNRRSETFTQLGNIRGQQADYYSSAQEMEVGGAEGKMKSARKQAENAYMQAAKNSSMSYKQQPLPDWISDRKGYDKVDTEQSSTNLAAATKFQPLEKAEGATLRSWS